MRTAPDTPEPDNSRPVLATLTGNTAQDVAFSWNVSYTTGSVLLSREFLRDAEMSAMSFGFDLIEVRLDEQYGYDTRHTPDRGTWWEITRPDRIRANIRANLPPGRPGRFVRCTSHSDLG